MNCASSPYGATPVDMVASLDAPFVTWCQFLAVTTVGLGI